MYMSKGYFCRLHRRSTIYELDLAKFYVAELLDTGRCLVCCPTVQKIKCLKYFFLQLSPKTFFHTRAIILTYTCLHLLYTENDWVFVQEDLTKKELLLIANDINPDKGRSLSSILHNGTHVWTELGHLHPPLSPRDRIFSVLERWFENVSEGPENRRTLANACKSVEQIRIANRIARKLYVTS